MKRFAVLALSAPLLAGCVKIAEEIVLMPDGSGKITYTIAMNPELSAMGGDPKDPLDEFMSGDPDELQKNARGIAALGRPERVEVGGWKGIKLTIYFDDVNQFSTGDDGKEKTKYSFRKEGEGFVFEQVDKQFDSGEKKEEGEHDDEETKKQMEEMFRKMMAGFELRGSVKLPGRITDVGVYTKKEGRTASFAVSEKEIQAQKDFQKYSNRKAACGASEASEAEMAGFKKELAKAKAEWTALRAEMKKNFEKKKEKTHSDEPEKPPKKMDDR